LHGVEPGRDGLADEAELDEPYRTQADLVPDEVNRRGAECGGKLGPNGDQRRTHDGECRWVRETTTTNEPHREATGLELPRDLWTRTVDDDDLVTGRASRAHEFERVGGDATPELQDDARHVVYSALSFT
jgi:hypothetical protein